MKTIIILTAIFLGGCATVPPVTNFTFPEPPAQLMVPPQPMKPLIPGQDGSIDPKVALGIIMDNNTAAKSNAVELSALQNWVQQTEQNVKKNGGKTAEDSRR
jgi:hypothetical protein